MVDIEKGNKMAVKLTQLTNKEKAEQLKKCCETIIENAEEIVKDIDYSVERIVSIHMSCHQPPTIKIEQEFISKKLIDSLLNK